MTSMTAYSKQKTFASHLTLCYVTFWQCALRPNSGQIWLSL